jgi:predicted amidophosphoribosyltransferase
MKNIFLFFLLLGLCSCAQANQCPASRVSVDGPMVSIQNRLIVPGNEMLCPICGRKFDKAVEICPYDGAKLNVPCKR